MKTFYLSDGGDSKGPFTPDQIHAMWQAGQLPADTLFFNDDVQEWQPLIDVIETFRPKSGLQKLFNPKSGLQKLFNQPALTEDQKAEAKKADNVGGGCCSIIFAILFLLAAFIVNGILTKGTTTDYNVERTYNPDPKPVRDPFKVYSPEEERKIRQKEIDARFPVKVEETERAMTEFDKAKIRTIVYLFYVVSALFLIIGIGGIIVGTGGNKVGSELDRAKDKEEDR